MAMRVILLAPALAAGFCLEKGMLSKDPSAPLPALYFKTLKECAKNCALSPTCQWFSYKEDSYPTSGACYIFTKGDVAKEADPKAYSGGKACEDGTTILTDAADAAAGVASNLQEGANGAAADVANAVNGQLNGIQEGANGAAATVADGLNGLQDGANGAAATVADGLNGIQDGASGAAADAQNAVTGAATDAQNALTGHLNGLQDGANGAVNSISNAFSSAGDHLTESANQAADHIGATFKGEGASGKAMAAGSQGGDNTALYAIVGGGVGAALIAAGAFAMMGDGSEKKPKKKRSVPKGEAREVNIDAEAALSAASSGLQMAAPSYSVPAPQPMTYQQPAYQPMTYQPASYQPASYQQTAMPAAQPMTYQAAPAYQPASMAASAYQAVPTYQVQ